MHPFERTGKDPGFVKDQQTWPCFLQGKFVDCRDVETSDFALKSLVRETRIAEIGEHFEK